MDGSGVRVDVNEEVKLCEIKIKSGGGGGSGGSGCIGSEGGLG